MYLIGIRIGGCRFFLLWKWLATNSGFIQAFDISRCEKYRPVQSYPRALLAAIGWCFTGSGLAPGSQSWLGSDGAGLADSRLVRSAHQEGQHAFGFTFGIG